MVAAFIDWNISAGSLLIFGGLITLTGMFFQFSRVGASTVQILEARNRALDEDLTDARENIHQAELQIKDREAKIAQLEARPDTEKVYEIVQQHHAENQVILTRLAETAEKSAETLAAANQMLTLLVDRHRPNRASD